MACSTKRICGVLGAGLRLAYQTSIDFVPNNSELKAYLEKTYLHCIRNIIGCNLDRKIEKAIEFNVYSVRKAKYNTRNQEICTYCKNDF